MTKIRDTQTIFIISRVSYSTTFYYGQIMLKTGPDLSITVTPTVLGPTNLGSHQIKLKVFIKEKV